jgi:saxitoxin biosynthesis operon SxtJ-like protein
MSLIRIDRNPSRRHLAVFGLLWLVFLAILGAMLFWRTGSILAAMAAWMLAIAVPAIGLFSPVFLRIVYVGAAYASFPIGWVVSHVILAAVYYLVLTPIGLVMRLVGYDPMRRRFDRDAKSYWSRREADESIARYFRQF